jgi:signal transduction histidine kinase
MAQVSWMADLFRLVAESDRLADVLPALHEHLLEVTGGAVSVVLEPDPDTAGFIASSGAHLDELPRDGWLTTPGERDAVTRARASMEPAILANLGDAAPVLAGRLGTPHALFMPVAPREDAGLLLVGMHAPAFDTASVQPLLATAAAFALTMERARLRREVDVQRALRTMLRAFARAAADGVKPALDTVCRELRHLFGASRACVWLHDRETGALAIASSSDARLPADYRDLAAPDAPIARVLRGTRAEMLLVRPDRDLPPVDLLAVPLRGRRRALGVLALEGVSHDPGAGGDMLARAEEAGRQVSAAIENVHLLDEVLRAHRELEDIFDSIGELIVVCDETLQVRRANDAFARRVRRERSQLRGIPLHALVGEPLVSAARDAVEGRPLKGGEAAVDDPVLNGTFAVAVSPVAGSSTHPPGVVLVARDVTERARLEADRTELERRLAQADKLAAIGQFVAGIAHELNNPLQGVLGYLDLLRGGSRLPPGVDRTLGQIEREAGRAAKIVRNLLVFSGVRRLDRRRVGVATILNRVGAARARSLRARGIRLERAVAPDLPLLHADPLLLHQALTNIVVNAEQAIGSGGHIEIEAWLTEAGTVRIGVHDSGPGIPPEVLPHVFEPFFTTKEAGAGTGLGLAIAYGIVQEHGGSLTAANHPSGGALFLLTLPAADAPVPARSAPRTRR